MGRSMVLALVAMLVAGCTGAAPLPSASPTVAPTPTVAPAPTPLPSPTVDPLVGRIRAAATATIAAQTVGFDLAATFFGNVAVKNGTAITGGGSVSFGTRRQLVETADYSALQLGKLRLILDDEHLYLSGSLVTMVPSGKWLLVDLTSKDPRALPFLQITKGQNDSSLVMYDLFGAVTPVSYLGTQDVDGVNTNVYQFDLELETAPDVVPAAVREHLLDAIAALRAAGTERKIAGEVWIGPDGLVKKVAYTYTFGTVSGGGTFEVVYTFRDFGKPIDLGIPKSSSVVRLEDLKH